MRLVPFASIALVLFGCVADEAVLRVDRVAPGWVFAGSDSQISIRGHGFYPVVSVDPLGRGEDAVDDSFVVQLVSPGGEVSNLDEVALRSYQEIVATVPAGMVAASYDVRVTDPRGRVADLADGLEVSAVQADRLALYAERSDARVGDTAEVVLRLLDPEGNPLALDRQVAVWVEDASGVVAPPFATGALDDERRDGNALVGQLGDDGEAVLRFGAERAGRITIRATSAELDSASMSFLWRSGNVASVHIELPSRGFTTTAGASFPVDVFLVDNVGNVVEDADEDVVLANDCGRFASVVPVHGGRGSVDVALLTATDGRMCGVDHLRSVGGVEGVSEAIRVRADKAFLLDVAAAHAVVEAGADQQLTIESLDRYGNRAAWPVGAVVVDDGRGGVDDVTCAGVGPLVCDVRTVRAAPDVRLTAVVGDVSGQSLPFRVLAGAAEHLGVRVDTSPVVAGERADVELMVRDAFDNPIDATSLDLLSLEVSADVGTADCRPDASATDADAAWLACQLFLVDDAEALSVRVDGLEGRTPAFAVVNGELFDVEVAPDAVHVEAGGALGIRFSGFDEHGNAYVVGASKVLDVSDTRGSIDLSSVTLGSDGSVAATASFQAAGATRVEASVAGDVLGRSPSILVDAGPAASLDVAVGAPWAWLDDGVPVDVTARDAYGNVAAWSGDVALSSRASLGSPVDVEIVDGVGTGWFEWSDVGLPDTLDAVAPGGLLGESVDVFAVEDCGESGPTAVARFGARDHGLVCLDPDEDAAPFTVSLATSTPGGVPIGRFALAVDDVATWSTSAVLAGEVSQIGRTRVRTLAVQTDGCAAEAESAVWAGPRDGEPVGPFAVTPVAFELDAGVLGSGTTAVQISNALECDGDPSFGSVLLRTDRGVLTGVAKSGSGLELSLSGGSASATLDVTASKMGGPGSVVGWVSSDAAAGEAAYLVVGDDLPPVVWSQTPSGDTAGWVDHIELQFSESLLASSVRASAFTVSGPSAAEVQAASLTGDRTVVLWLAEPVDASAGEWEVVATASLRDAAGNRLAGTWSGKAANYTGRFGDLPSMVDPVHTCSVDVSRFAPDGDEGGGEEADAVKFSFESASRPSEWVISITTGAGIVARHRVLATGAVDAWAWDARDVTEAVVPNGRYTLSVQSVDEWGNLGAVCTEAVWVANHAEASP